MPNGRWFQSTLGDLIPELNPANAQSAISQAIGRVQDFDAQVQRLNREADLVAQRIAEATAQLSVLQGITAPFQALAEQINNTGIGIYIPTSPVPVFPSAPYVLSDGYAGLKDALDQMDLAPNALPITPTMNTAAVMLVVSGASADDARARAETLMSFIEGLKLFANQEFGLNL